MSKVYKVTMYIDDVSEAYYGIEDIKSCMENYVEDVTFTFESVETLDITDYIEEVEDDYPWNHIDEKVRLRELQKYFKENDNENS